MFFGGDTAGEGSDKNTATVIDNTTEKIVATLEQEKDETSYTIQVYCLGMYYNQALIGLETNFSTYPTKMLSEVYEYPNLYVREKEDDYTGQLYKSYGFETNKKTRPIILANFQRIMNEETSKITDIEILREGIVFIKNEKGRPEAQQGCHDDRIMGTAITYYISDQQPKVKQEPMKENEVYMKESSFDNDFYSDFDDDEITPI
jgi:phage terminase large subunit